MKKFIRIALSFAIIGFIVYLLTVVSSFFGYCVDMDCCTFHKILVAVFVGGALTFGWCLIRNCKNIK